MAASFNHGWSGWRGGDHREPCNTNDVSASTPYPFSAFTMSLLREVPSEYIFHDIAPHSGLLIPEQHGATCMPRLSLSPGRQGRRTGRRRALARMYLFNQGRAKPFDERKTRDLADRKFCNLASLASCMCLSK